MSAGESPDDALPPACRYFRETMVNPIQDDPDDDIRHAMTHVKECASCADAIGTLVLEMIKRRKQEDLGT